MMQTPYPHFFIELGYQLDPLQPATYTKNPSGDPGAQLTLLSQTGLIEVSGEDCVAFLQNMTSNDVQQVSELRHQLSGFCTHKGRLLAVLRIFLQSDKYFLAMPVQIVDSVLKRLNMYVLRSKVQLKNVSGNQIGLGLSGVNSINLITTLTGRCPEATDTSINFKDISILRVTGTEPRFELFAEQERIIDIWKLLHNSAHAVSEHTWLLENIRAGLPVILPQTQEAFVPQMVNLDLVQGVSFKKGCYPGQEIVARTHYLGKIKRRMHRVHFQTDLIPEAGMDIFAAEGENHQTIGTLVSLQALTAQKYEALAVIQQEYLGHDLRLQSRQGPRITVLDLPYSTQEDRPTTSN